MASTYSPRLRVELQTAGENEDTWGQLLNASLTRLEDAIAGSTDINCSSPGNITLTTANGAVDQARQAILRLTGVKSGNVVIIVPDGSKRYGIVDVTTGTGTVSIRTVTGTPSILPSSSPLVDMVVVGLTISFASVVTGTGANQIPLNSDLGTAATKDFGTAAGNLVELNAQGFLPALNGSLLTGVEVGTPSAIATGTVDVLAVTFAQPITSLDNSVTIQVRSLGNNISTTPTINVDGLGAVTIVKYGNQPLSSGDTGNSGNEMLLSYTTANGGRFELLNPVTPSEGLGVGQTWQDVTASRQSGVVYTNTSGSPISLSIRGEAVNTTSGWSVQINSLTVAFSFEGSTRRLFDGIIVPDGATYQLNTAGAFSSLVYWLELR